MLPRCHPQPPRLPAPAGGASGGGCVAVVGVAVNVNAQTVLVLGRFRPLLKWAMGGCLLRQGETVAVCVLPSGD